MKRYCQTLELYDDKELIEAYVAEHAHVWEEVKAGIREVGITDMQIYIDGNRLFMIMDTTDDFDMERDYARLATLPRQAEWEAHMAKYHFIIIGSGWRALYYVRVAKALPEIFSLDAMYCRTQEKADLIAGQYQIHTTTSIEECVAYKPDFAVVAVKKDAICDVSMEWLDRGITVLSETPAALDMDSLNKLYSYYKCGKKQVVAEQYREYPNIKASLKLINEGIIGDVSCANVSLAHEYHGMSLIRAFLGVKPGEKYTVSAKTYEFPTTQTLTRDRKSVV